MRCPECKSKDVARGLKSPLLGNIAVCYSCGYTSVISSFLESGDILPVDDTELTYEEVLSAHIPDKNIKSKNEHPLLEPDNPHYNMVDGVESILRMEQMYSTKEMMTWTHITVMKYRLRIGAKDNVSKELGKIKAYEAYYKYLKAKDENK